ncbi:CBS domain-containing protein [Streptomyces sp. RK62]|uniref:CBS domain-containing protein n=1 Tax=Streptomyces sp. RK62 TaxID=2824893 RepID=UPI001B35C9F1|nr:CBS domain-containing protein [Streptomyces sp. RK62]MBQ0999695.1 CBS domain-containing protein [Streptomyces sp. RK62]
MKHDKVGSVMTTDVVRAEYGTPFKEVARLLARHHISGLPVVDDDEMVLGVLSETDLLARHAAEPGTGKRFGLDRLTRAGRRRAAKAEARTAGQLMTEPPITVHADETIVEAARTMAQHRVERLPVLDEENRLVGIVTRRDLLQVFLRPDEDIRAEVVDEVLARALWLPPRAVTVTVVEGVVTVAGHLERRSETEIAVSMARQIDGVVAVVNQLSYRLDDAHTRPEEPALHGFAHDWLRGP